MPQLLKIQMARKKSALKVWCGTEEARGNARSGHVGASRGSAQWEVPKPWMEPTLVLFNVTLPSQTIPSSSFRLLASLPLVGQAEGLSGVGKGT